jgi:phage terminase large subunit-like protein
MEWTTACPDWEERVVAGRSLIPMPPLFPAEAERALDVFRALRVADVAASPMMGEICRPWIMEFVAAIFGAYDEETGRRLIIEFLLSISKKNAKSTIAAGIMMTALIRNWRDSAEFLILAPTLEIANNSFFPAREMVKRDPELTDLFHVQENFRRITHRNNGASLKVVAADNEAVSGKKATGVLVDELWLFGKKPHAENMLREATGGLASRPEGFTIFLTTQSDEPPAGVFRQKLLYARGVRDGKIDDRRFLPVLYEFPESLLKDGRPRDKAFFFVTNPNLNASVSQEFLERGLAQAENDGEASVRGFLAKHLNVEIGLALMSDRWTGADFWEVQERAGITLDLILAECDAIDVGIDGGGLDDLLGLTVVGRRSGRGEWLSWSRAWAHPSVLERRKSEAARFKDFERDGDLVLVERIGQDVDQVANIVARVEESGVLDKVGVDPVGIGAILDALEARGVPKDKIVGISQGFKLNAAILTAERRLAEGALWHAPSRMMNWCVGNAKVEPRGNAILITKQASGRAKIDPLMALFDAVSLMQLNPESSGRSFWETRKVEPTAQMLAAIDYIRNAGEGATRAGFIEDCEPVGEQLLAQLEAGGFVRTDGEGRLVIIMAPPVPA